MEPLSKLEYQLRFTTPAFLGGADQQAQWRTPPIKALLRQWWRIRQRCHETNGHTRMREEEGDLLGNAWLDGKHRQSRVRLRLESAEAGQILSSEQWQQKFRFDRVETAVSGASVSADVYLGYGAVLPPSKREGRNLVSIKNGAIATNSEATLTLIAPARQREAMLELLALLDWFGTLGSRSRNGWGSLTVRGRADAPQVPTLAEGGDLLRRIGRPWQECLLLDWPHAVGTDADGRPLLWLSEELPNWPEAINRLARIKVAVRQAAKAIRASSGGGRGGKAGGVHFLGYPAGSGGGNPWDLGNNNARLASQLRFKVVPATGDRVRALVTHLPCALPRDFIDALHSREHQRWLADTANQERTWQAVHDVLRQDPQLTQSRS